VTEKAPAEQVIREMVATACPNASRATVHLATNMIVQDSMSPTPTAERAESFGRRFASALRGGARTASGQRGLLGAQLKERYEAGASIRELAEELGRSYGFVHRLLVETGTPLRGRDGRRRPRGSDAARARDESQR